MRAHDIVTFETYFFPPFSLLAFLQNKKFKIQNETASLKYFISALYICNKHAVILASLSMRQGEKSTCYPKKGMQGNQMIVCGGYVFPFLL